MPYYEFRKSPDSLESRYDKTTVSVSSMRIVSIEEMVEMFEDFLKASGFYIPEGHYLGFVEARMPQETAEEAGEPLSKEME